MLLISASLKSASYDNVSSTQCKYNIQPLDGTIFGPLKSYYTKICSE